MVTAQQTVDSGIVPIVIELNDVVLFDKSERLSRTFLTINSLDLGVLGYDQYRVVAKRSKQANKLTLRHMEKLMRIIPSMLVERPEISCFIVPTYTKLIKSGDLAKILVKVMALYPDAYASKICIEIPSDVLYDDLEVMKEAIKEIKALGFKLAVSEVGDTFCPAFRLAEIPIDYIFLDKSAITRITQDSDGERIVASFISYLKGLGSLVFAPYLYDDEITAALRRVGCDGCVSSMVETTEEEGGEESTDTEENSLVTVGGEVDGR